MHALIVDDNAKNAQVLKMLLSDEGWTYTIVTQVGLLESVMNEIGSVDLVFLDLEMPGANGYEVLRWLRTDARFAHVPVVANTVHVSEINTVYGQGFQGFIAKPVDPDRFPSQLARIMNGEPVWEAT